jgi:hypothetical protein
MAKRRDRPCRIERAERLIGLLVKVAGLIEVFRRIF